jgi:hypothetical protein
MAGPIAAGGGASQDLTALERRRSWERPAGNGRREGLGWQAGLDARRLARPTVVLASALRAGLTDKRVAQLTGWLCVPKRAIERCTCLVKV